ncbi:conserved hypothetical protein [Beggiatoa sp. PS]|nr:conserved hypothetical protein [Beggiatoa sp. PS]
MEIKLENGLPYISVTLSYQGQEITFEKMLLDTGSMGTLFAIEKVDSIDLLPEYNDRIREICGIGGREYVFSKTVDYLISGEIMVENFEVEIGDINYGIEMDGICGLDFLLQSKAIINLEKLELSHSKLNY